MTPILLEITNFGPFRDRQVFHFPRQPGFYFLWGDNQEQPRLGPNGAGKTKLLDALTWVIYGKTTRGLTAGDAANWAAGKGTVVALTVEVSDGVEWKVTRTWGPNSWTMVDEHGEIHDLAKDSNPFTSELRLEFTPFLHSVLIAQGQPMFLDLKAEPKARLFSEVMGLDHWLDYSSKASKKAGDWDMVCRGLERDLAKLDGQLKQLNPDDLEMQDRAWRKDHGASRKSLERDYARLLDSEKEKRAALVKAQTQTKSDRTLLGFTKEKAAKWAEDHAKVCPECGQEVHDNPYNEDVAARKEEVARSDEIERRLARELAQIDKDLDRMEFDHDHLVEQKSPYAALLDKMDQAQAQIKRDRSRMERQLDEADSKQRLASYWVRWFKDIRLGLISEALSQLELEVNSCVNAHGLVGWELRFEVDRASKSGSIQRGFNVFVQSPHNSKPVPWEAWSGGESQRLRLATQEGLGNLIRERTGATFNLEVWDEPTQFLGGEGVTDLLDSLAQRAKEEGRQIWLIDHRSLGYGNFDGHSGVIKKKGGSIFDQSGLYISGQESPIDAR